MAIKQLSRPTITRFQKNVLKHYAKQSRSFPWRKTIDPYEILVSEIMLQQTQADRVIDKYVGFLKKFPTARDLTNASVSDVIREWKGLGYNRRALYLKKTATVVEKKYDGVFPESEEELLELPGIGSYTAAAVMVFAFNKPVIMIETNIRSVFIDYFFKKRSSVSDSDVIPLIGQTLYRKNPRRWYSALMDYGSFLKKTKSNPSRRSAHHVTQKAFKGSNREKRGQILSLLLSVNSASPGKIKREIGLTDSEVSMLLDQLKKDGLIKKSARSYTLP